MVCNKNLSHPIPPQQNGMVERLIRRIKEQCIYHHRFENIRHAELVIADWTRFYNDERPHQLLGMKSPSESFKLAIYGEQNLMGHYNPELGERSLPCPHRPFTIVSTYMPGLPIHSHIMLTASNPALPVNFAIFTSISSITFFLFTLGAPKAIS